MDEITKHLADATKDSPTRAMEVFDEFIKSLRCRKSLVLNSEVILSQYEAANYGLARLMGDGLGQDDRTGCLYMYEESVWTYNHSYPSGQDEVTFGFADRDLAHDLAEEIRDRTKWTLCLHKSPFYARLEDFRISSSWDLGPGTYGRREGANFSSVSGTTVSIPYDYAKKMIKALEDLPERR